MLQHLCVVLFVGASFASNSPLPYNVKPCARSDPNFNDCALRHGREALPRVIKGDKKYKLPSFNPLEIAEMKISSSGQAGFSFKLTDIKIYGYENIEIESLSIDLEKKHIEIVLKGPVQTLLGKYEVAGRILVLPIQGKGELNMTNVNYINKIYHDINVQTKDGKKVWSVYNVRCELIPQRVYTHLTNLFNGDKLLGEQMNNFLNENWQEIYKEFHDPTAEAVAQVVSSIMNSFANVTTFDQVFPETLSS